MALIPLYRAREAQPQDDARLDAKNPLAARFHSAYAPALRSENLSAGGAGEGLQSHAAPAVQLPTAGRAASIVAVNQRLVSGPSFGPTPAYPITMVWIGQQGSTANTQIAGITSAGGIGGSYYYIGGGSSTQLGFSARNNYGSALAMLVTVPGGTALGVELVVVVQSLSANNHRASINGSAVATDAKNIGAMVAWDRVFMGQSASANNQATAFFAVASGGAPLTDEQMQQLSRDPRAVYALFEPQTILVPVSAGGAVDPLATETDTALTPGAESSAPFGLATDTSNALALAGEASQAAGLATELDGALAPAGQLSSAAGLANETDTALALISGAAFGLATETDTALALSGAAAALAGMALETDTALALVDGGAPFYVPSLKIFSSPSRARAFSSPSRAHVLASPSRAKSFASPSRALPAFASPSRAQAFVSPRRAETFISPSRAQAFVSPARIF